MRPRHFHLLRSALRPFAHIRMLVSIGRMDRYAAVYCLEMEGCAALADVGVDAAAIDLTLDSDREAHRYTAVYRFCDQVCGIVIGSLY